MSQSDPRLYNPNRDIAHCFGDVMREVADRLEDERWEELSAILKREGVCMDDLGDACAALCVFVASSADNPKENMFDSMDRCNWFKASPGAQVAVMAILGTVVSGYFFHGVRESTLGGDGPTSTLQDLRERGEKCSHLMQMSRTRRWVTRRFSWVKRLFGGEGVG